MKPLSIQLYTLREQAEKDFFGVLECVAEIGYKAVETAGLHGQKPKEVAAAIRDLGLKVSSAHVPMVTRENCAEQVDLAGALGYDMLITSMPDSAFGDMDALRRVADQLQQAAELLQPHGLSMGYHNHWYEFYQAGGKFVFDWLMELAPAVFSELDIYWASNFGANDPAGIVAANADRIRLLHVKDGPLVWGQPHSAVGSGKLAIPDILAAADEPTVQYHVVELDDYAGDMMQAVAESYRYLTGEGLSAGNR